MQRKLHPLEGIVAICALLFVLFVSVGFAQAQDVRKIALRSSSALVQDAGTGEVVIGKNADAVVSIASITKLMTAMVILDHGLDLDEEIVLGREDAVRMKGSRSRLRTGLSLTRGDLLLLALMASDNRAAAALGRSYPGGIEEFVDAMNAKAAQLEMEETRFVEPTGLSPANVSTASDLAKLVRAAHEYPLIREYSTKSRATVRASGRPLSYGNTNNLVRSKYWDIELSKTGYISEAGRCLVMQVRLAEKDLIVVLLDSWGKHSRIGDANRIRKWLESGAASGRSS
ncbi:MAG TPA: D-alanyl-D-alanine endopeptidase [Burkholderiales bacterium]|jgi:D-alanyl-D-alanine endopeptidase (penicillin-binding protein 7)|nr:D-alanyl-D-alanine endopeptidase [Burkholderiales bacterium]